MINPSTKQTVIQARSFKISIKVSELTNNTSTKAMKAKRTEANIETTTLTTKFISLEPLSLCIKTNNTQKIMKNIIENI